MKRQSEIFSNIEKAKVFADIGCDHGYLAEAVVKKGLAEKVIISDISAPSLKKAENLLDEYVKTGKVIPVLSDGFNNFPLLVDEALIAGMGGEIISKILNDALYLPNRLILQPMKNAETVRRTINSLGYKVVKDYTFFDIKFYDLIIAEKGEETLTNDEYAFGKTNLKEKPKAFIEKLTAERLKLDKYLQNDCLSEEDRAEMQAKKERINKIL